MPTSSVQPGAESVNLAAMDFDGIVAELIGLKIDGHVIDYIVILTSVAVRYASMNVDVSVSSDDSAVATKLHPSFYTFVAQVIIYSEVTMPTVLVSLVYICRAKPELLVTCEDLVLERVFLGALIVASKYANDSSLKNIHWSECSGIFGLHDVSRIEREFLYVLDFTLTVTEEDLVHHHKGLSLRGFTPNFAKCTSGSLSIAAKGTRENPIEIQDDFDEDIEILVATAPPMGTIMNPILIEDGSDQDMSAKATGTLPATS